MNQTVRNIYLKHHYTYDLKENIRFELAHGDDSNYYDQLESDKEMAVVENGKKRANLLFKEVFKEVEMVQLIFFISQYSRKNRIDKYLYKNDFQVIDSFVTSSWNDYFDGLITGLVIETKRSNLRVAKLIDGIFYQDFCRSGKLKIKSPFVFYNEETNTILNIYDDRGCDIWSDNREQQTKLYYKYNSWILDYDRENIAKYYEALNR